MPAVIRELMCSRLAAEHSMIAISTYRTADPLRRLAVFGSALLQLISWSLRPGVRLVHVHTTVRGSLYRKSLCVFLATALGRRVILHLHSGPGDIESFSRRIGPVRRALFRRAFATADRVVSVSRASAEAISSQFDFHAIDVVPNAAPLASVRPASLRESESESDPLSILYLGGFKNPVKGGGELLDALPSVLAACPSVAISLAGPGELPPAGRALVDGESRLRWLGWLDERAKAELFARSDIFVLPSTSEGLPVAVLEAMAYGRAIVATSVGGVPEILTTGEDAVIVAPGNPAALAAAMQGLAGSSHERRRLGQAARARAERLNSLEVEGRLDALYRELTVA